MSASDTIYALATGSGRAAIAVVRLSGRLTQVILEKLTGTVGEPRLLRLRGIIDPEDLELLDEAMVVWMPGPSTYTGEDCAEFHVHASRAVLSRLFDVLANFPGVRLAEAGEFTRRAVSNGKMDLVEAEGLGDLLAAQTAAQRRLALRQMSGNASSIFDSWRERLLLIRADIEAAVDFADERGVIEEASARIDAAIVSLIAEMEKAAAGESAAETIRNGVRVILSGHPNTGKSALLNAVARRDVAIVSGIPGTTRDVLEVILDIGGYPVILADTAGLRNDVEDEIEREGIARSRQQIRHGDIVVWVASGDVPGSGFYDDDICPDIIVCGKCDIRNDLTGLLRNESGEVPVVKLSARTGEGIQTFIQLLQKLISERFQNLESPIVTSSRQKQATQDSIRLLNDSLRHDFGAIELKAEDIRMAADAVGRITGRTEVEEWLGAIFSRFCIGK
jgi:tRNA modification GTPase